LNNLKIEEFKTQKAQILLLKTIQNYSNILHLPALSADRQAAGRECENIV
jgi:hypothetical protein